jgi:long-chain acyl-CoA synthetase
LPRLLRDWGKRSLMNLYNLFHETAQRQPDHPAVFGPGPDMALCYGDLDETIRATSRRLGEAGVAPGDCVGLHYPSGTQYIIFSYAVWRCGGCVVPIPMELAAEEKCDICRQISLEFVISPAGAAAFAGPFCRGPATSVAERSIIVPIRSPCEHPAGYSHAASAFIRFTSGTTGASKGVVLSHQTIYDRIHAANEALAIGPEDRVVWLLSMSYHFTVSIVAYLTFGAALILPANRFAAAILDAARRFLATFIYASSNHCALLAAYEASLPLPTLRRIVSTTYPLDSADAGAFRQRYGLPVTQALGIIEVGLPCINLDFAAEKSDSVGRVLPAYELRLDDVGLGPGLGEVLFRGKGMLDAYYRPWRQRDQILADGWFRTGDVGQIDADGCLFLRGRCKDVITVLGMKFFPQEVEAVLTSHPSIEAACVFANRHPKMGEVSCAHVVAKSGSDKGGLQRELRQLCARRLASYKIPESIEMVDSLQRTASGKILHRQPQGGQQ